MINEPITKTRDQLIIENLPLVKFIVNRMTINLPPGLEKSDLLSIGSWGLIDAAQKFDPTKGVLFKTYACTRIKGAILDELRRLSLGGQTLCRKTKTLEKAVQMVEERTGKPATDPDIAKEMGMTPAELESLYCDVSRSFLVSLDQHTDSESPSEFSLENIEDHRQIDPSKIIENNELKDTLKKAINSLPSQEKQVLALYYYEELTFKEIGLVLEVSESRICQIHTKAMVHLRTKLARFRSEE